MRNSGSRWLVENVDEDARWSCWFETIGRYGGSRCWDRDGGFETEGWDVGMEMVTLRRKVGMLVSR